MANITLSSHSIQIRRTNSKNKDDIEILDRIGLVEGADINLFRLFDDYFTKIYNTDKIEEQYHRVKGNSKKIWKLQYLSVSSENGDISGIIGVGEGGLREDIVNLTTLHVDYQKQPNQAGLRNYYFLIHIPPKSKTGFILLQRFKNQGIQSIFGDISREIMTTSLPRYQLLFDNIFSKEYFQRIRKQWFPKEVRVIQKITAPPSGDIADFGEEDFIDKTTVSTTTVEHVLKIKYGGRTREAVETIFKYAINLKQIPNNVLSNIGISGNYERYNLVVREKSPHENVKDRERTIKLGNIDETEYEIEKMMLPYRDITDSVTLDDDGYPTFESINKVAHDQLGELIAEKNLYVST